MGKTRKLLCNKTLMVKGVGFEDNIPNGNPFSILEEAISTSL